jgi:putative two-component system response regulator
MHDVGKIHTPDHILQSEHHLSTEEFEVIKQHCIDGEVMLGDARFFETARAVAREHHERWDGKGYPDGKAGHQISLAARIVSVADVFDALTSKRPYKDAWSLEEGMASITAGAGVQFDPDVVATFQSLQHDGTIDRIRQEVETTRL